MTTSLGHQQPHLILERKAAELLARSKRLFTVDRSVADLIAGSFAGVTSKLVEYPFDTVKVRLQCQDLGAGRQFVGAFDCFKYIVRTEGWHGVYKGFMAPMFGAVLENAVLFASYGKICNMLKGDSDQPLSIAGLTVAGAVAGSVVSFVMTPVELIKCRMQMQKNLNGSMQAIASELRVNGVLGLYKGHFATLLRETFGGAAWFGCYELMCKLMSKDGRKDSLSPLQLMTAGSVGGIGYNAIMFPADVVKSQIQAEQSSSLKPAYLARLKALWVKEGIRGLYRGFGVTVCRAIPSNAVIFGVYEFVQRSISDQ